MQEDRRANQPASGTLADTQGSVREQQIRYWWRKLSGLPPAHNLPLDRMRPARLSPGAAVTYSRIDVATTAAFEGLCRSEGATLLMGLHAAFALLLGRHSGDSDVAIGTPTSSTLGTLVLRADLSQSPTFRLLLAQSREALLAARANASLRFHELLELLQIKVSESCAPLVQLMLVLREDGAATTEAGAHYDLTLEAQLTAEGLALHWAYATDLFEAATIARLAGHFDVLMRGIVAAPDEDMWRLPIFDDAERRQILVEWNDTAADFGPDQCIHELFEAQVRRTPQAFALDWGSARITYFELNERANRLAWYLRSQGLTAESLVGVCMERSLQMVVALLAILKAGGAYLPLDPQYPKERLGFMLADSAALRVVTQKDTDARVGASVSRVVLDDPAVDEALKSYPPGNLEPLPGHGARSLGYIIYTSGSTGVPKGVCIEHRQAVTLIHWARGVYDAAALSGVLAATSICFDISVFELFVPLCCGGRAVIVEHALDVDGLMKAQALTLINTVPSAIKAMVEEGLVPSSVKIINLAGEALAEGLVQEIYQCTAVEAVYNLYGPTEDTTYSTYALIRRDGGGTPSIGKPMSNGQVYVLDAHLQPVPIGVVGEIYVGGAGVARCYWNRPELTAERFIPDPFSAAPGSRLYKTGDLALWSARGELQFIGRRDHQIKLRGLRIELGEVQAQLLAMQAINDALVMARDDARREKQLVAYVVPADTATPVHLVSQACHAHLRTRLPDYMIPTAFIVLGAFPLTPNGKVDRSALPAPALGSESHYEPPASSLEEQLARIWQSVLLLSKPVSATANFFELGGQSLLATRILSRVRRQYGVGVPLRALFGAPTLREFARVIAQGGAATLPPLRPVSRLDIVPLSFGQRRLWFLDQFEGGSAHYHLPLRFLLEGELHIGALQAALRGVAERHESIRTVVTVREQQPVQRILDAVELPLVQVDLRGLPPAVQVSEVERIAQAEALVPFALDCGPMMRATLLLIAPARYELLLTLHHIAADGWSLDVLRMEIGALYRAALAGSEASLPPLPVQYADFAVWQHELLQGEVLEVQRRYWTQQLSDLPLVHNLPLDRPRRAQQGLAGASHRSHVDAATTVAFTRLCRERRATLFMGLHAVFSLLLARHSGDQDIVVGTPIANREQEELAPSIGFFVNTLVLRSRVGPEATFLGLLSQSEQVALSAYAHQHLPFEQLVTWLQPERSLSHAPLIQIMLVLQNTAHAPLELP
jgi:amino acid adenylation domain-containing protein